MPGGLLFGDWSMAPGEGGGGADSGLFREAFPSMFRNLFPARRSEQAGLEKRPVYPQLAKSKNYRIGQTRGSRPFRCHVAMSRCRLGR